jgi:Trypsin-like peptidase domain
MKLRLSFLAALLTVSLSPAALPQTTSQAPSGSAAKTESAPIQFVRSISGSKGGPDSGKFVMEDPRSAFYVPDDHQAIVYMEWDGTPGKHHIEAFWKNPEGKVVVLSDFDYDAKQKRFGAFWTLTLSETMPTGTWTLEAHVDGEIAGSHKFEVLGGARPSSVSTSRRELTAAELYEKAVQSSVAIERLDASGNRLSQGSGFLLSPGWIVTAFEAIDGASRLRLTFSDGRKIEGVQIMMWDRRKDWAVLPVDAGKLPALERAAADSWNVGDEGTFLVASSGGNRVITATSVDGKSDFPVAGPRLNLSSAPPAEAIGSALLNNYGEVIGVIVGSLVPGASSLDLLQLRMRIPSGGIIQGGLALPLTAVPNSMSNPQVTSLEQMMASGQFIPPVTAGRNIVYGQLARSLNKQGSIPVPAEGGETFSRRDAELFVYVMWEGHEKAKGLVTMRLFDLDNHPLGGTSKPTKLNLNKGERVASTWSLKGGVLAPGFYRVDVWLDDAPAWRQFFQVTE